MATVHAAGLGSAHVMYVKGSVESILSRCQQAMTPSADIIPFNPDDAQSQVDELTSRGLRVLAFARGECSEELESIGHEDIVEGLVFLGLQGMIDPPRPEAIQAVRACQHAGIEVKMITGDHAGTARQSLARLGSTIRPMQTTHRAL